jgi:hypothetical protein
MGSAALISSVMMVIPAIRMVRAANVQMPVKRVISAEQMLTARLG